MAKSSELTYPLSLISLYTGAGGLDLGFEAAGFSTCAAVELDNDARATLKANRPHWPQPENGNALTLDPATLLELARLKRREVDALVGGPPCQPFSKSAFWAAGTTRRLDDPRARTLEKMLDLTEAFLPRVLVIENVRGIAYRDKDEAMTLVQERLAEINERHGTSYTTTVNHLQANDFGVPQIRERAFLVSFRDGQSFTIPEPVSGDGKNRKPATAWDAIGNMSISAEELEQLKPRGKWARLLSSIPEGENYLWHTEKGGGLPLFGWRTRFWSFLLKLAKNKPAWTIQADPGPATGPFHWESRLLSIGEMARLQSFPVDYRILGDYRSARRQIGNAVPPALAEAVARSIRSTLRSEEYSPALCLAVPRRGKAPAPENVTSVAEEYRALAGEHAPHPGKGKGPAALRRKESVTSAPQGRHEHLDGNVIDNSGKERPAA